MRMTNQLSKCEWNGDAISGRLISGYHAYAAYLVRLSWPRFLVLSVLVLALGYLLFSGPTPDELESSLLFSGERGIASLPAPGRLGSGLLSLFWAVVIASAVLKATYKGRLQAEAKAAAATETAEQEMNRRQVTEARLAAMQAQVEPHFLFNTLASIDHLIETDPPRASRMQKSFIEFLRQSMPALREDQAIRSLGRELAIVRAYLEILKVRMEERLQVEFNTPEGLLSAQFPPMMLQSLVENAIKHGLEPRPEGGLIQLRAEVVDGDLIVSVADTGVGFGQAASTGSGVGLGNIRERLRLLYGQRASLAIRAPEKGGVLVAIRLPYQCEECSKPKQTQ